MRIKISLTYTTNNQKIIPAKIGGQFIHTLADNLEKKRARLKNALKYIIRGQIAAKRIF